MATRGARESLLVKFYQSFAPDRKVVDLVLGNDTITEQGDGYFLVSTPLTILLDRFELIDLLESK